MKIAALATSAALLAAAALAAPAADSKLDRAIRASLPSCPDVKIAHSEFPRAMPMNLKATVVTVESPSAACHGEFVSVTTSSGGFFLGMPWMLDGVEGATVEEKLKAFTWNAMRENVTPVIEKTRTPYGLHKVTLEQTTPAGKVPIYGEIDPEGRVFFFGRFRPMDADFAKSRLEAFAPHLASAPATGASSPKVTVIEFSDFQCPSCKHASGYLDPILAKHGANVRYIRYDLPLMSAHPWALSAAVAGRAIYRQNPEAFWKYKKAVYESQDKLNTFVIDDFSRGFAEDHGLDLAKYDADIVSQSLKDEILQGIGMAFSNDVRATPTYIVNGQLVDAGEAGKGLVSYIENLLQ